MQTVLRSRRIAISRTAAVVLLLAWGQSHAGEMPWNIAWNPSAAFTWSSDYVLRGVSQSDNLPVVQADLHVHPAERWSVGAWASGVRLLPGHVSTELDFYVETHWAVNQDLALAVSVVHYNYVRDPRPISYRYNELSVSTNWFDTLFFSASWSPDTVLLDLPYGVLTQQQTLTVDAGYHQTLPLQMELSVGVGYYYPLEQRDGAYTYGSIGVSHRFGKLLGEVNWYWTQDPTHRRYTPGAAGGPWVATFTWKF